MYCKIHVPNFFIENYFVEIEWDTVSLTHLRYGNVTANIITFDNTIFAYSTAVLFSNDSSSDHCAVLFVNNMGVVTATSRFINRCIYLFSRSIKYLLLLLMQDKHESKCSIYDYCDVKSS